MLSEYSTRITWPDGHCFDSSSATCPIVRTKQKSKKQRIILPNNVFYEGYLINNEFNGYGEYRSPYYNYFGYFSYGKKNGKGKLEDFEKKLEYNGDFKDDMKDGFGEEKYQDGSIYIGQFKQNMKNGNGNLILAGGNNYGYNGMFINVRCRMRLYFKNTKKW